MESLNLKRTMYLTEDEIRDNAKVILGFDEKDPDVKQGTGQITTFNQLGFKGVSDKPDGWYLPNDKLDMSANFKPIFLNINKLLVVLFAFRQEHGNVIIYVLSCLFIS